MRLSVITVLLSIIASGCNPNTGINPQTRKSLDKALKLYKTDQIDRTIEDTTLIIDKHHKGPGAMQAHYLRGLARRKKGNLTGAAQDFTRVYNRSYYDNLHIKAADALAEIKYRFGDLIKAEELLNEVIRETPAGQKPCDHAHYRLGCIMQQLGRWPEGATHMNRVSFDFPSTKLATRAEKLACNRAWTIQIGAFSSKKLASNNSTRFKKTGFEVFIKPDLDSKNQLIYLLLVGSWNTHRVAASKLPAIRKLKADAYLRGMI